MSTMRAAVVDRYGPAEVVRVVDLPRPEPGPGEVLVRVVAAEVSSADARIRGAAFPPGFGVPARLALGIRGPRRRVLGSALAGTVEAVGPGVDHLASGDAVCGMTGARMGAHAELVAVPAERLVPIPPGVPHEDAAGVLFGGTTARYFLLDRLAGRTALGPGVRVLVNGAAGAVGTVAVQLTARTGAEVTGVCSARNLELVRDLGADVVIDRGQQDVLASGERYDVILDTVGVLPVDAARRRLREGGTLLLVVASLGRTVLARGDVLTGTAPERPEEFRALVAQLADGTLRVVRDGVHALEDVVDAHTRVDGGRKVGVVLVRP